MPYREYLGWQEFYEIEPWGLAVDDNLNGYAIATMVNLKRDSTKTPEPYKAKDFMLFSERKSEAVKPILYEDPDMHTEVMMAAQFGGKGIRDYRKKASKK